MEKLKKQIIDLLNEWLGRPGYKKLQGLKEARQNKIALLNKSFALKATKSIQSVLPVNHYICSGNGRVSLYKIDGGSFFDEGVENELIKQINDMGDLKYFLPYKFTRDKILPDDFDNLIKEFYPNNNPNFKGRGKFAQGNIVHNRWFCGWPINEKIVLL